MRLFRQLKGVLGLVRRRIFEQALGVHFRVERDKRGVLLVLHRDAAFIRLFDNSVYDLLSYWRSALFLSRQQSWEARLARITALAHGLEKGLSFPRRKPVFGILNARELITQLEVFESNNKLFSDDRISWALSNLKDWYDHHVGKKEIDDQLLASCLRQLERGENRLSCVSSVVLDREIVQMEARGDYRSLSYSRHSVRDFSDEPVEIEKICEAVSIATRTPSACNRQSVRTISFSRGRQMDAALALQNGNRGFSQSIDKLLIVAFDMRGYLEHTERNLGYVDAGMYAMSLIHSLHFLGLGSCCLNWAVDKKVDQKLHEELEIPTHMAVACLIAVGNLPMEFKVAASHRLPIESGLEVQPSIDLDVSPRVSQGT